ncbi:hypothetical protein MBLNU230_g5261t1 [Neophaeotheca triangularis]
MDEDFFSDDDLDQLADALEQNAYRATQSAKPPQPSRPLPTAQLPRRPQNASSLNRPSQGSKLPQWKPPQVRRTSSIQPLFAPPPSAPEAPSSDYGLDDEDVIDLDETSFAVTATSTQPQRQPVSKNATDGQPNPSRHGSRAPTDDETLSAYAAADAELGAPAQQPWNHAPHLQDKLSQAGGGGGDTAALQAKIIGLENERQRLQRSVEEAQNTASAKVGEIKIVRANQEKANKEYERRIAVLNKLHADEVAKQKAEIEATKKERQKMQTDNQFLQHDLAQEADRAKRVSGPSKARSAIANGTSTPKRNKRKAVGDGFADDELARPAPSPSRSKEKSKDATPKHGAKRKRSAQDSPVAALSFTQPPPHIRHDSSEVALPIVDATPFSIREKRDERYEFVQFVLAHRIPGQDKRTVESCLILRYPSQPDTPLSSMMLDTLMSPGLTTEFETMAIHFARSLLTLWSRCLAEKYYAPVARLLTLIRFVLDRELPSHRANLIEEAIPVCCKSIDLIAVPIARYAVSLASMPKTDSKTFEEIASQIDVDEILAFLHHLAECASLSTQRIDTFWRYTEFTFSLMMLNKAQPICQIITSLQMLSTSALPGSFGAISPDPEKQTQQERDTIGRLTSLLFEKPIVPSNEDPYSPEELTELRLEILQTMRRMCQQDHGSHLLAHHRTAIGRLIRFLHEQLNQLYTAPPRLHIPNESPQQQQENPQDLHTLLTRTISTTTALLHHLLNPPGSQTTQTDSEPPNLPLKLSSVRGGYHKFLVSFTRLAFREPLLFELGIEDEVVEAAHAILDSVLSPEEGEAVVRALETPRGSTRFKEDGIGGSGGSRGRGGSEGADGRVGGDVEMGEAGSEEVERTGE